MASNKIETDSKGIPLKSPNEGSPPVAVFYVVMNTVFGAVGYAVAFFWAYSSSKQEAADAKIEIVGQYDLGWLYLGLVLLKLLQLPLGIMLGDARRSSKVQVPDQHVYKVMGASGTNLGYVLMEQDGAHGKFNRAQRAWQNYCESLPTVLSLYVAASWVFPMESFVCAMIYAVSRVMSASGYKSSADGRMGGLFIGGIVLSILQGMLILVAMKTLM